MRRPSYEVIQLLGLGVIDAWLDSDPEPVVRAKVVAIRWVNATGMVEVPDLAAWGRDRDRERDLWRQFLKNMTNSIHRRKSLARLAFELANMKIPTAGKMPRFYGVRPCTRHQRGRRIHPKPTCA